jgi:hypothetical protein
VPSAFLLGTADLTELLEHRLLALRSDPHPSVSDRDLGRAVDDPRSYVNAAALGGELQGVGQKI